MFKKYYMSGIGCIASYDIYTKDDEIKLLREIELKKLNEKMYTSTSRERFGGKKVLKRIFGDFKGPGRNLAFTSDEIGYNDRNTSTRKAETFTVDTNNDSSTITLSDKYSNNTCQFVCSSLPSEYIRGSLDRFRTIPFCVVNSRDPYSEMDYFLATSPYNEKSTENVMPGIMRITRPLFLLELFLSGYYYDLSKMATEEEFDEIMNRVSICNLIVFKQSKAYTQIENDSLLLSLIRPYLPQGKYGVKLESPEFSKSEGVSFAISRPVFNSEMTKGLKSEEAGVYIGTVSDGNTIVLSSQKSNDNPFHFYKGNRAELRVKKVETDGSTEYVLAPNFGKFSSQVKCLKVPNTLLLAQLLKEKRTDLLAELASDEDLKKLISIGEVKRYSIASEQDKISSCTAHIEGEKQKGTGEMLLKRLTELNVI